MRHFYSISKNRYDMKYYIIVSMTLSNVIVGDYTNIFLLVGWKIVANENLFYCSDLHEDEFVIKSNVA